MSRSHVRRGTAALVAAALALVGSVVLSPSAGAADPPGAGLTPTPPPTVTADALPTVQIDGVVWKQVIVGNTVYAGGEFTAARPAGAAPGVSTVPRSNLLAYDLRTGVLISSFAPTFNGKVSDLAATPDGTKLVAVGTFDTVNGQYRGRAAVFNLPSGTLSSTVAPDLNGVASAVAATNSTIYFGGYFSAINGHTKVRVGAVRASNGALLPFNTPVDDGQVQGLVVSPDGSQVVMSGNFTSVGGSTNPGYGMARVDATTGAMLPLPVNDRIRNAGLNSGILRVAGDDDYFYGVGWHWGRGGNSEGTFAARWDTGAMVWLEDCHGDTYDVAPVGDVVYTASHKHFCGNSGGFPQTNPWRMWHSTAWTKTVEGVNLKDIYNYPDHPGTPRPGLLPWFPKTDVGSYTGQNQAVWSVTGNDEYVVYGGEFPKVNGAWQQGIVRYAVRSTAPNQQGPRTQSGYQYKPRVDSLTPGTVRVTWPAMWDRDDDVLTHEVLRDTTSNTVHTITQKAFQWNGQQMTFTDTGLTPGSSVRYSIRTSDPHGLQQRSDWATITVGDSHPIGAYGESVVADGATMYWRLNEPAGSNLVGDSAGFEPTTTGTGVTRGIPGALLNSADTASAFNGTTAGIAISPTQVTAPNTFSEEVWFKTTSTTGGKIAGFGNSPTGLSGTAFNDRHLYMTTSGQVVFGIDNGARQTITSSAGLNDGQWHQAVGTMDARGMTFYIDGKRVGTRPDVTTGKHYMGFWRVGWDRTWSGSQYFNGSIDEFSVYSTALSASQVNRHWVASGRAAAVPPRPADALGQALHDSEPDSYWRLAEASGTTAADAGLGTNTGTYLGTLTRSRDGVVAENKAVGLGATGNVVGTQPVVNPTVFSQEVWLRTTTSSGGRIFGFGTSTNGTPSATADRQLYMLDSGKVRFGVDTGAATGNRVTIDSTAALNDGRWHQVVSTFDAGGMKLYVDGQLNASNPNAVAKNYTGRWKLGGDTTFGGHTSTGFQGDVDEAAVYPRALPPAEIAGHFAAGGTVKNVAPSAVFSSTLTDLTASFDGSGSSDVDGTVVAYAWDFGDSSTGSGAKPAHTYAAAGTYPVTLTVTDDKGDTGSITQSVTVTAPNVAPTAAFTSTVANLKASFDGSGSSDVDGTVVSYAWNFGDSTTGSGSKPEHTYAAAGTYQVKLTVTDDKGAAGSLTKSVTVSAPPPPGVLAMDGFERTVGSGWGNADVGGPWTLRGGDARFNVAGGAGNLEVPTGTTLYADLDQVSSQRTQMLTEFSVDKVYEATYIALVGRQVGSDSYRTRVRLQANGQARIYLLRNAESLTGSYLVPGLTVTPGAKYKLKVQVTGVSPTTVSAKLWRSTDTEPAAWQVTGIDPGTANAAAAALQAPGPPGVFGFVSSAAATGVRLSFHDIAVTDPQGTPNVAPKAAFTSTVADLKASFDGSGSSDPDGTVASYAWEFGDSTTGTGAKPEHTYATAGTYQVRLTVTDDKGATDSLTRSVTVTAPPVANVAPTAAFTSTVADLKASFDGSGSSDPDGTVASHAWDFGDSTTGTGATPEHTYAAAGTYQVRLTVTDDKGATGSLTKSVTVTAPPAPGALAADGFERTLSSGWGTADVGGPWTLRGGDARFNVAGGAGNLEVPIGTTLYADLNQVSSQRTSMLAEFSVDKVYEATYIALVGRQVGSDSYRARVRLQADGQARIYLLRNSDMVTGSYLVPGLTVTPGAKYKLRVRVTGTSPTTLSAKLWRSTDTEPAAWQVTGTDPGTANAAAAALQAPGPLGVFGFVSNTAPTPVRLSFHSLAATAE